VAILGVPFDENSTFMRGAALGPPHIREALHSSASNLCAENGVNLETDHRWQDLGDLVLGTGLGALEQIEGATAGLLAHGASLVALGGDHSITYPLVRAFAERHQPLTILHLDAHPDLYDVYDGNRYAHACPFARIMEEGLAVRLVQMGIRTMNPHQRAQAERFGVTVIQMQDWPPGVNLELGSPLYLSVDMDVLDPAFAPGVAHQEPGGLSTRELLHIIHSLPAPLVGADIVEVNPLCDQAGITSRAAAKLLKEIVAQMLQ
jgi:agmatinase